MLNRMVAFWGCPSSDSQTLSLHIGSFRPRMLLVIFLTWSLAGCGESQQRNSPIPPTPEVDLEWAMMRLQHALDLHQSSKRIGLRIKREMRYDYRAPDSSQPKPTAQVTLETVTAFMPDRPTRKSPSSETEDLLAPESGFDDPYTDPEEKEFEDLLNSSVERKSPSMEAQIDTQIRKESKTFDLVYEQEKWRLVTQPVTKIESFWFEYALDTLGN